jgi:DNA-binding Xre family transcriptional regulator
MTTMDTIKRSKGDAVVFMALMFLCHFLKFGMSELIWIILNTG